MQIKFKLVEKTVKVRDQEITFIEKIAYDENGEELYHRETEIENYIKLYDIYKQKSGLLTTTDLKELRNIYNLSQKELADKIGIEEQEIYKYENGSIQSKEIDRLIRNSFIKGSD